MVLTLIRERIGTQGTSYQAYPDNAADHTVTVLAVVEKSHAVVRFGKVDEPVRSDLEPGSLPRALRPQPVDVCPELVATIRQE